MAERKLPVHLTVAYNSAAPGASEWLERLQALAGEFPGSLVASDITDVREQRICYGDALDFVREGYPDLKDPQETAATLWTALTGRGGLGGKKYPLVCSRCQKQRPGDEEPGLGCQCRVGQFRPRQAHWTVNPSDLAKITLSDISGLSIRQGPTRERILAFLEWLRP